MIAAGSGHLSFRRKEFRAQVPQWLTDSETITDLLVVSVGVFEILLGLAIIFWSRQKVKLGIVIAVFFLLVLPGNVSQYTNGIDAFGLDTDRQRLIRLFLQPILILWALWSSGAWQSLFGKPRNDQ
jgi:uncharacterized membrane protein